MKSVLVTGGTVRLGKAISERLAADGWRVVTSSHRPEAGADITADLSADGGVERLFSECARLLGGMAPDALVNNAAVFDGDAGTIRRVNFEAPAALVRLMAASGCGRSVVNIVDSGVFAQGAGAYIESKRELLRETLAAARRNAGSLRVNAVAPGPVFPPPGTHVKAPPTPFGRPTAEAVALAVSFFLSSGFVSGQTLCVDGGATLADLNA